MSGAVLASRAGYIGALDELAARRSAIVSSTHWPGPDDFADAARTPHYVVAVGGSAAVAQVVVEALHRAGVEVAHVRLEPDEVDAPDGSRDRRFVFVSASGASRSMAAAIDRCAGGTTAPLLFTLDPRSTCAVRTRRAGGRVVAPDTSVAAAEFLATTNLVTLLWLVVHAFAGPASARAFARAFDRGRLLPAPASVVLRRVSRIGVISDAAGRAAAIDFGTRCRELGGHPVTELSFADFVHGSYNAVQAAKRSDVPWTVLFAGRGRALALAKLFPVDPTRPCTVVPVAGPGFASQARALGYSLSLHRAFVEAVLPESWVLPYTPLGVALWNRYR